MERILATETINVERDDILIDLLRLLINYMIHHPVATGDGGEKRKQLSNYAGPNSIS